MNLLNLLSTWCNLCNYFTLRRCLTESVLRCHSHDMKLCLFNNNSRSSNNIVITMQVCAIILYLNTHAILCKSSLAIPFLQCYRQMIFLLGVIAFHLTWRLQIKQFHTIAIFPTSKQHGCPKSIRFASKRKYILSKRG